MVCSPLRAKKENALAVVNLNVVNLNVPSFFHLWGPGRDEKEVIVHCRTEEYTIFLDIIFRFIV